MIEIKGKGCISAKIIKDSVSLDGARMTTFELEYPRFILSEVNTHRMLSKNSASSRAIPVNTMHEIIKANTARPIYWGKNQPGMAARVELDDLSIESSIGVWDAARDQAISHSKLLSSIGNHKQVANRLTEPFQVMKTVLSGTEFANLYALRDHTDAQPEFSELARCMRIARDHSVPKLLKSGEWHVPYVATRRSENSELTYWADEQTQIDVETAKKISASCCAQVSYRRLDTSLEKALQIFDKLNLGSEDEIAHASPVEHQATPMIAAHNDPTSDWEEGVTHMRHDGSLWSGNLRGWVQYRQLIPREAVW